MKLTTLAQLNLGDRVSLERAVTPTTRLGGHFVQGHVDGVGRIVGVRDEGTARVFTIECNPKLSKYVVMKGFICVDGVSLTVIDRHPSRFQFMMVPYTQGHVALLAKGIGSAVNIEVDILAKYVEQLLGNRASSGLTAETLEQHGFFR